MYVVVRISYYGEAASAVAHPLASKPRAVVLRRWVPAGAGPPSETDTMDLSQPEQVVLDGNAIAKDANSKFFHLAGHAVRPACAPGLVSYQSLAIVPIKKRAECPGVAHISH